MALPWHDDLKYMFISYVYIFFVNTYIHGWAEPQNSMKWIAPRKFAVFKIIDPKLLCFVLRMYGKRCVFFQLSLILRSARFLLEWIVHMYKNWLVITLIEAWSWGHWDESLNKQVCTYILFSLPLFYPCSVQNFIFGKTNLLSSFLFFCMNKGL